MILGLCHFLNSRLNSIDLFEDVCPIKAKKGHTNVLAGLEILAIRMKMLKGILIDVPISMALTMCSLIDVVTITNFFSDRH